LFDEGARSRSSSHHSSKPPPRKTFRQPENPKKDKEPKMGDGEKSKRRDVGKKGEENKRESASSPFVARRKKVTSRAE
jgi:hypothetical protein